MFLALPYPLQPVNKARILDTVIGTDVLFGEYSGVMDVDLQGVQEVGFLGIGNKPFDVARLAKMIRRVLDAE